MTERRKDLEILNYAGSLIALSLVGLLGFALWALVYVEVPVANNNTLTVLIGILSANIGLVVGFFFGSSQTSRKAADTIATMASTANVAQAALPTNPTVPTVELKPGETATVKAEPDPKLSPDDKPQ